MRRLDGVPTLSAMRSVSLRSLVSKITALAISTTAIGAASADPKIDCELTVDGPIEHDLVDEGEAAHVLSRGLALALGELKPLTATHLAASWALSDEPLRRLAVAQALEWMYPLVGDSLVIDHLSRDDDPAIRAAAARAAWIRRPTGGDAGVLARLAGDPDPTVRAVVEMAR